MSQWYTEGMAALKCNFSLCISTAGAGKKITPEGTCITFFSNLTTVQCQLISYTDLQIFKLLVSLISDSCASMLELQYQASGRTLGDL